LSRTHKTKLRVAVGAAAFGAMAFILISSDNGGDNETENLPSFYVRR
jgi:hypothetical protein